MSEGGFSAPPAVGWTVLGEAPRDPHGHRSLHCRCACGTERVVRASYVRSGRSRSCGECHVATAPGRRFGRLTVRAEAPRRGPRGTRYWLCDCRCGRACEVSWRALSSGVASCGCLARHDAAPLVDRVFGAWTVLGEAPPTPQGDRRLRCRCACRRERAVRLQHIVDGTSTACSRPCARRLRGLGP